jgi:hypothetical protein
MENAIHVPFSIENICARQLLYFQWPKQIIRGKSETGHESYDFVCAGLMQDECKESEQCEFSKEQLSATIPFTISALSRVNIPYAHRRGRVPKGMPTIVTIAFLPQMKRVSRPGCWYLDQCHAGKRKVSLLRCAKISSN